MKKRCRWCTDDPDYIDYHDHEWGIPLHDDYRLFEMLALEGAQAGLSWLTVLKKRESYREAFDGFQPQFVAKYGASKVYDLLHNPGIIRNRLKIEAAIQNARCVLKVQEEYGSLDSYLWSFVGGKPVQNAWKSLKEIPCQTLESDRMSKELKRKGFTFVGTKICYAFMQAVGMVNDHEISCFCHKRIRRLSER
jgi:DNA-3-methyladenine glycosylase I